MAATKELGKITHVRFGVEEDHGLFGLFLSFGGMGWGVGSHECVGSSMKPEHCATVMTRMRDILKQSKRDCLTKLVGVPVEVTFDGGRIASWRVLEEVL